MNNICITPVDSKASDKVKKLLKYLADTMGNKIITGQHTQTNPMEEIVHIKSVTGKCPKLIEFEMLSYSPNINYNESSQECLTEIYENRDTLSTALITSKKYDIIPMLCFHWFSPLGGKDKAFYSVNTDFDPAKILIENTPERKAFFSDLDYIASQIKIFDSEDIAVLWRPFHEAEGTWFWWGSKGGKVAAELYKLMFDYFVNKKGLHNLLWVWSSPSEDAYPGDKYVDIVGWDIYLENKQATDYKNQYQTLIKNTTHNKVTALTEVGYNPDIDILQKSKVPWAFYMTWSKEFSLSEKYNTKQELKKLYDSNYSIKL